MTDSHGNHPIKGDDVSGDHRAKNFIEQIIDGDIQSDKHGGRVITRFPPEPNGYLHIGHAKSICLNFGLAQTYGGECHLRFDDTNPTTEDPEYVASIQEDIRWLGFDWGDRLFFASDYFERFYQVAVHLINQGLAYVCSLNEEDIRSYRGTVTQSGTNSPFRDRSVTDNLDLFARMRAGEFQDGEHVLRAKIDMSAANMKMRDPLLYRIRHAHHYRTGDRWCIYPMYDFAHPLEDAFEGITHSICTLEFENNRDIYDWVIANSGIASEPRQYEFARLNLSSTVMSKRKLLHLVETGKVTGWDDPRMPTVAGMRRRGYTAEAIRAFCDRIGVAKANSLVDLAQLEFSLRDDLNHKVPRVLAVLNPLKVVLTELTEDHEEWLEAPYFPADIGREGSRHLPLTREIFIDRDDFNEHPPKGYYRLAPGAEVRLRHAYIIRCQKVIKDEQTGEVRELHCSMDRATLGVNPSDRKVKGAIHWVSARLGLPADIRLYDRLFSVEQPGSGERAFTEELNPTSLSVVKGFVEPELANFPSGTGFQFERLGFFCSDLVDSQPDHLVFNRTVTLRDSWAKSRKPQPTAKPKKAKQQTQPVVEKNWLDGLNSNQIKDFEAHLARGLSADQSAALATSGELHTLFIKVIDQVANPQLVANWVLNEVQRELKEQTLADLTLTSDRLAELLMILEKGAISTKIARQVFRLMLETGGSPQTIIEAEGLNQTLDEDAVRQLIDECFAKHVSEAERFLAGESKLQGFFVGKIMKLSGGKANPGIVNKLLKTKATP